MSRDHRQTEKEEIARDILAYLYAQPDAQDTLEGIVQWWLLERKIRFQTKLIQQVLSELINDGRILKRDTGHETAYQLNRQRKPEK